MIEQPHEPAKARMRDAAADLVKDLKANREADRAEKAADESKKAARKKYQWLWVAGLVVAFGASLAYGLPRWRSPWVAPAGAEAERSARETLAFAARVVEAFRVQHGRVPDNLAETRVAPAGVLYRPSPSGWELSIDVEGRNVVLRSSEWRP